MNARIRIHRFLIVAVFALSLTACGRNDDESSSAVEAAVDQGGASGTTIALDSEQLAGLGVTLSPLDSMRYESRNDGPALVIDTQPVVEVMAALTAAEAAARQSRAARERASALFGSDAAVSRETLEASERQAAADEAALDTVRARTLVAYGSSAPWLDASRRTRIIAALTRGEGVVVRASFPAGLPVGDRPVALALRPVGQRSDADVWRSETVWLGPADPSVPGPALYAYVDPAADLVSGARLIASYVDGAPQNGVVVPVSAVVFSGGSAWCYVAADGDGLVRVAVDLSRPVDDGYFQASGFEVGQAVVTAGAGLLLATEVGGAEEED